MTQLGLLDIGLSASCQGESLGWALPVRPLATGSAAAAACCFDRTAEIRWDACSLADPACAVPAVRVGAAQPGDMLVHRAWAAVTP